MFAVAEETVYAVGVIVATSLVNVPAVVLAKSPTATLSTFHVAYTFASVRILLSVTETVVDNVPSAHVIVLSAIGVGCVPEAEPVAKKPIGVYVTEYSFPLTVASFAALTSAVASTTGVASASSENASAAGASVATAVSDPSLNSAAHTGTLEVASIATTSDILNVFFAMPFFVFLIFVMIIVPLWVVDRLILEKISYEELISDLWNIRIL